MPATQFQLLKYDPTAPLVFSPPVENKEDELPPEPPISLARLRLYYLETQKLNWILHPEEGSTIDQRFQFLLNVCDETGTTVLSWPNHAGDIKFHFQRKDPHLTVSIEGNNAHPFRQTLRYDTKEKSLELLECHHTGNIDALPADLRYFIYSFLKPDTTRGFPENDLVLQKTGNDFDLDEFTELLNKLNNYSLISILDFLKSNAQDIGEDGCSFWIKIPGEKERYIQVDLFPSDYISNISKEKQFLPLNFCNQFLYYSIHVFDWAELEAVDEKNKTRKKKLPTPKPILELRIDIEGNHAEIFELKKSESFSGKEVIKLFELFKSLAKNWYLNDSTKIEDVPLNVIRALSGAGSFYLSMGAEPLTIERLYPHDREDKYSPLRQNKADYFDAIQKAGGAKREILFEFLSKSEKTNYRKLIKKYPGNTIKSLATAIIDNAKKNTLDEMRWLAKVLEKIVLTPFPAGLSKEAEDFGEKIRIIEATRFFVFHKKAIPEKTLEPPKETAQPARSGLAFEAHRFFLQNGFNLKFEPGKLTPEEEKKISQNITQLSNQVREIKTSGRKRKACSDTTPSKAASPPSLKKGFGNLSKILKNYRFFPSTTKREILKNTKLLIEELREKHEMLEKELSDLRAKRFLTGI